MVNIVLCGGSGTRLWPISRKLLPKQFIKFDKFNSLFQEAILRNDKNCNVQIIIANSEHFFLASDQIEELNRNNKLESKNVESRYILEPVGRNTAPAIALACNSLDYDDIVLVSSSDHLIKKKVEYSKVVEEARKLAENGNLVTFGIKAEFPETGYGYIQADGDNGVKFHEKPDIDNAKKYLKEGNYYWNSGMFCFKAGVFLEELQKHSPAVYDSAKIAYDNANASKPDEMYIAFDDMLSIPDISIDNAVMEKSDNVKVVVSDIGWSDLGSYDSLDNIIPSDENGNTTFINKSFDEENESKYENLPILIDSKDNLIFVSDRKISTIDVDNLIVVDTPDALLITKKGSSQKVKSVVEKIKQSSSGIHNSHLTVHRPWGTYTILEESKFFKIKKILVKPGKRLSLQKHFHRNEHWIVVSGIAQVTIGEEERLVRPNESTYIKMGDIHRLENPGKINLVLIEVQVGEYTEEDDIVRISDDFSRV